MLLRRLVNSVKLWRLVLDVESRFSGALRCAAGAVGVELALRASSSNDRAGAGAVVSPSVLGAGTGGGAWGMVDEVIIPASCGWLCVL